MGFNKGTYLFIFMLLACTSGMAQMNMSFRFSPIATSNSTITMNGGNPIIFNGEGKCVTISSGMSVLTIANNAKGEFGVGCKEIPPVAIVTRVSIGMKVYPNPTSGLTTFKCEGQFDENLSAQVRVFSMEGKMMMAQMVPMKEIKSGFVINADRYPAGTYVISMDFMNQRYNTKFIKL